MTNEDIDAQVVDQQPAAGYSNPALKDAHADANAVLCEKLSATVTAGSAAVPTAFDPSQAGDNQVSSAGRPHPGHASIDEILRVLHVQNAGEWMRAKLEELRKTL